MVPKLDSTRTGATERHKDGYSFFLPKRLQPDGPIDLVIDKECIRLLSEADRSLGELKGICETLPDPDLFIAFYVKKEALLSSQIEGTQCSLDEVIQVSEKTKEVRPVNEVINYINAMNFGLEELKKVPFSIPLLHQIHSKLMEGVRGKERHPGRFKTLQNWLGAPGCSKQDANYVPPPPESTEELMNDLTYFYHAADTMPVLILAAIIHSHFETIHPYEDGNGRLGRLLTTFMLCEKNVIDKPILYLSLFFKENRGAYYESLMAVRFEGLWEQWIKFFLRGVKNTSIQACETAREILALQEKHRAIIREKLSHHKLASACYDLLCKEPVISITKAAQSLDASYPGIKQMFLKFLDLEILIPYDINKKRNKLFSYHEYLEILKRGT